MNETAKTVKTKEAKVSKGFVNVLTHYANEKARLENEFQELFKEEQEVLKEMITVYDLGKGDYSFTQREDGLYLICVPTPQEDAPKEQQLE